MNKIIFRFTFILFLLLSVLSQRVLAFAKGSQAREVTNYATCKECHLGPGKYKKSPEAKKANLPEHGAIKLAHMKKVTSCQICHATNDIQKLKLLTGELIENKSAPILCGQCHGIVKRDWDQGIHGKKVNVWGAKGELWSCIKCHDPHAPSFPEYEAGKSPKRPTLGIEKEGAHHE